MQSFSDVLANVHEFNARARGRRSFHHAQQIADLASQSDRAGTLGGPFEVDLLTGRQVSLRDQKASANAEAGDAIVKIILGSPAPISKEVDVNARMSSLFNSAHGFCYRTPTGRGSVSIDRL